MNKSTQLLETRRVESGALLTRIVELLEVDSRVGAAWLFGSRGRGTADDLSDIDLWVAVDDAHMSEVSASRRDYVARPGTPLLIEEAPQNAPTGGAYLLVL